MFNVNCCDGIYNSFDVHFTSLCDNKCAHCIDTRFCGTGTSRPNPRKIAQTIINNKDGYDDVLFLGGEPMLFLEELNQCIDLIKEYTKLKIFVTTSVPKTCYDKYDLFIEILSKIDGLNLSVQHYKEEIADEIRKTKSKYDRQVFYSNLPFKEKIRINLNIVKPFLYEKEDVINCLKHYDKMGFNSIKMSEIQHGKDYFVSFQKMFYLKLKSPFSSGCQNYIDMSELIEGFSTKFLLKRSCFMCEETLKASLTDGLKVIFKLIPSKPKNKYSVVYENGELEKGWI